MATDAVIDLTRLPAYDHRPLENDTTIRVLALQPSRDFNASIEVDIFHLDRATSHDELRVLAYEAVSYCWGKPVFSHSLWCDDRTSFLLITENVDAMLRHFRNPVRARFLWIDAICLNQGDNMEKSQQVQLMGDIYRGAAKVDIWLGVPDDGELAANIFAATKQMAMLSITDPSVEYPGRRENPRHIGILQPDQSEIFIDGLFGLPWFTRRWVVQEVAHARHATVYWGHVKMSWAWFAPGLHAVAREVQQRFPEKLSRINKNVDAIISLTIKTKKRVTLEELVWRFHATDCADPRDRIFALYSMVTLISQAEWKRKPNSIAGPKKKSNGIDELKRRLNFFSASNNSSPDELQENPLLLLPPVNYTNHWSALYIAVAGHVIATNVESIWKHLCAFGSLVNQLPRTPTWVPDWTSTRGTSRCLSQRPLGTKGVVISTPLGLGLVIKTRHLNRIRLVHTFQDLNGSTLEIHMQRAMNAFRQICSTGSIDPQRFAGPYTEAFDDTILCSQADRAITLAHSLVRLEMSMHLDQSVSFLGIDAIASILSGKSLFTLMGNSNSLKGGLCLSSVCKSGDYALNLLYQLHEGGEICATYNGLVLRPLPVQELTWTPELPENSGTFQVLCPCKVGVPGSSGPDSMITTEPDSLITIL
jgi:hypothetical protein